MGLQQAIYDALLQGTNQVHKAVLALSGGRLMSTISGMPAVELHTTGRKSGQRRSVMLTSPVYEPNRVVLVASKGGTTAIRSGTATSSPTQTSSSECTARLARCELAPPPTKNEPSCGRRSSRRIAATTPTSGAPTARSPSSSSNHADPTFAAPPGPRRPKPCQPSRSRRGRTKDGISATTPRSRAIRRSGTRRSSVNGIVSGSCAGRPPVTGSAHRTGLAGPFAPGRWGRLAAVGVNR